MQAIESIEALEAHYGKVSPLALSKVCDHITALYQRWIKASRFMILSTVGPGGTDASPRGDRYEVASVPALFAEASCAIGPRRFDRQFPRSRRPASPKRS